MSHAALSRARDGQGMDVWGLTEGDEIAPGRTAIEPLGAGLRYETYLAWDEGLRALVVAKVLLPGRLEDRGARRAMAAEAELLERLRHPMLLRAFGAELEAERPHLVLEHIEGPRLSTLIRRFGVIVEQLLPLALSLCAALHYLSGQRVVHLDVKPSNVIMAGAPRLIDLSVARTFDRLATIASPIGTDAYMAPEQCTPELFAQIGPPADVWGLGATLYEALARERPFQDDGRRYPQLRAAARPLGRPCARRSDGARDAVPRSRPGRKAHGRSAGGRARAAGGQPPGAQDRPFPPRRRGHDARPRERMRRLSPRAHRPLNSGGQPAGTRTKELT